MAGLGMAGQGASDGQLWFAGEATSAEYFGATHGVVLSGREAALGVMGDD